MEQPKWLKLSALGLLIVILGLTYFVVVGKFSAKREASKSKVIQGSVTVASPTPSTSAKPSTSPNAYQKLTDKQAVGNAKNLPNTGFAEDAFIFFTAVLILSGMILKKYSR